MHLGPGKTGQIAFNALEYPQLKKLIDGGELAIVDDGPGATGGAGGKKGRTSIQGYPSGSGGRRSGDR